MNQLLEIVLLRGLLPDVIGVLGLGLLAFAAVRLGHTYRSWGGTMMALGAIALLVTRLYFILSPHFITNEVLYAIGPIGLSLMEGLPTLFLTFGLAGIVWGLWCHERWMNEEAR